MPTPEEIVKSLAEDGREDINPDSVKVGMSPRGDNCSLCGRYFDTEGIEDRLLARRDRWNGGSSEIAFCLDRPECRTRKAADEKLRLERLDAVKL